MSARAEIPPFTPRRLLLVVTGAIQAAHAPYWVTWLRGAYPDLEVRSVLTRSALRFTTEQAMSALTGHEAHLDEWPAGAPPRALHVDLAEWADAIIVHPASAHYVARAALGLADTPSLLVLHASSAPIAIAPSLPPGLEDNPVYRANLDLLARRPNVVVSATRQARSATTGRSDARGAAPLTTALRDVEELLRKLSEFSGKAAG
ncbi:flavoprotein [Actinosynnema mirum]|uniref:Flavoprotein n=1 Tax=Actinosynnema mirum (strain ATCC 29888 / DSM 43827 / JCM 3225 / NBRC 14064 / NCIMB 13271 / NRRL B-12336 / IMRU 3971 / 101) TaxID=446462 RepID=C6WPH4_ACTMD|nr:flavoprotein [Actinosynnema mirum]ACU38676.1 flavoprotein [Actinosynnema mirum DSM 43827]